MPEDCNFGFELEVAKTAQIRGKFMIFVMSSFKACSLDETAWTNRHWTHTHCSPSALCHIVKWVMQIQILARSQSLGHLMPYDTNAYSSILASLAIEKFDLGKPRHNSSVCWLVQVCAASLIFINRPRCPLRTVNSILGLSVINHDPQAINVGQNHNSSERFRISMKSLMRCYTLNRGEVAVRNPVFLICVLS